MMRFGCQGDDLKVKRRKRKEDLEDEFSQHGAKRGGIVGRIELSLNDISPKQRLLFKKAAQKKRGINFMRTSPFCDENHRGAKLPLPPVCLKCPEKENLETRGKENVNSFFLYNRPIEKLEGVFQSHH